MLLLVTLLTVLAGGREGVFSQNEVVHIGCGIHRRMAASEPNSMLNQALAYAEKSRKDGSESTSAKLI